MTASGGRVLVVGGPRTGKTTLAVHIAAQTNSPVHHTDDLIGSFDWSSASEVAATWFSQPGPWVIEGVAVVRAVRKWLATNDGKPADRVVLLQQPKVARNGGQRAMAKGHDTVWDEVVGELRTRGVEIEER